VSVRTRELASLTWPEIAEAISGGTGVVLPVGATEQHGPHLPVCVDALLATDLAHAIAEPADLLVAPAVSYGYRSRPLSGGGQGFAGTTSLTARTLMALVEDVLREFLRQGFERMLVLNWHMENSNFVYEAAFLALEPHAQTHAKAMVMELPFHDLSEGTLAELFPDGFPGWSTEHASIFETSLMLHLHPELVLFDRAVDDAAARAPWWDAIPSPPDFVPASGVLWKSTQASAEKGRLAWSEIVPQAVAAALEELAAPAAVNGGGAR
jgi:creatinine amidohydrolase